jgi:hypothetical protein
MQYSSFLSGAVFCAVSSASATMHLEGRAAVPHSSAVGYAAFGATDRMAAFLAFVGLAASIASAGADRGRATTPLPFIRTSETDAHFYDEFRRVRIFHGSNRVQKGEPWLFPELLDPLSDAAERFASMGFNVVRLGWMWTGFNPAPNVFNMTYASEVLHTVQRLADHGVYTLLDTHQARVGATFVLCAVAHEGSFFQADWCCLVVGLVG